MRISFNGWLDQTYVWSDGCGPCPEEEHGCCRSGDTAWASVEGLVWVEEGSSSLRAGGEGAGGRSGLGPVLWL